jgi:hypothetical protein
MRGPKQPQDPSHGVGGGRGCTGEQPAMLFAGRPTPQQVGWGWARPPLLDIKRQYGTWQATSSGRTPPRVQQLGQAWSIITKEPGWGV